MRDFYDKTAAGRKGEFFANCIHLQYNKMPEVILHYFNIQGKGELIRLLLAYGEIEYQDKRIAFPLVESPQEWIQFKASQFVLVTCNL